MKYTFSFVFFGVISISVPHIGLAHVRLGVWGLILIPLVVPSLFTITGNGTRLSIAIYIPQKSD